MKKKIITPDFRFPYSYLKQLADETVSLIERDKEEFADRGYTPDKKKAFTSAIESFEDFPTDEQFNAMRVEAGTVRDTTRTAVETQSRTILLAARNVFGETSAKYREFGNADLTRQTDADLVRTTKSIVKVSTKYLSDLEQEGITVGKIAKLEVSRTQFDNAIDAQKTAVSNRDNATEQRIILGNALYALVVKYNDTGKDIWATKSESRYNDYVIYNTVSGKPEDETPTTPPSI